MTKNEVKKMGKKLAQYIVEKIKSYDLDFDFREPKIQLSSLHHESDLLLNLWGYKLPGDVEKSDEGVLTKFLSKIFNEFIASYDIDYTHCEYRCYIYDDTDTALFKVNVIGIRTED